MHFLRRVMDNNIDKNEVVHTVIDGKFYEEIDKGLQQINPVVVNEKDGSIMVLAPAGEFEMGMERMIFIRITGYILMLIISVCMR